MPQRLPYQDLLEEFGSAFNVEGLAETPITWDGKGKILEQVVERARFSITLRERNQDHQDYKNALIWSARELIAANTTDRRYANLATSWVLDVSCSFVDAICTIIEQNKQSMNGKNAINYPRQTKIGTQKLLPAPERVTQPSSAAPMSQPIQPPLQETPSKTANEVPETSKEATSSRKRGKTDTGQNKGKQKAQPQPESRGSIAISPPIRSFSFGASVLNKPREDPLRPAVTDEAPSNGQPELGESGTFLEQQSIVSLIEHQFTKPWLRAEIDC